ncbi:MAG: ACT domain-containing protein [Oscillospiraceae bacterium]|nr:ACT domain-containing protein [Oscillospiraceae bacterium]
MKSIANVTYCQNITLVTLPAVPHDSQIISKILTAISQNGVNVDMISQTAPQGGNISLAFSVATDSIGSLLPVINSMKPDYPGLRAEIMNGAAKINFYDESMIHTPGVAAHALSIFSNGGIQVYMITTSAIDISILVMEHDLDAALALCCAEFGELPTEVAFS